jgi:hypothetical protein
MLLVLPHILVAQMAPGQIVTLVGLMGMILQPIATLA